MSKIVKEEIMLTTIDNPFDPFTQFQDWYTFDCGKRYDTYNYLDRVVNVTKDMTKKEVDEAYNQGMKDIVFYNPELYRLVSKEVEVDETNDLFA